MITRHLMLRLRHRQRDLPSEDAYTVKWPRSRAARRRAERRQERRDRAALRDQTTDG